MRRRKFLTLLLGSVIFTLACFFYFSRGINLPSFSSSAEAYYIKSDDEYPKILKVVVDPLDVKRGDIQKMMVEIEDPVKIVLVEAKIEHDNGIDVINLKKIKNKNVYFGEWRVHSTHKKIYHTTFLVKDNKMRERSVTLAWSDPCSPPYGGDWTLDGNCIISGVDGVDNGNFTVDGGYTLTIQDGGTFVWNPGKSIFIKNGSIAINQGGLMKKTYLWMKDSDSDGYSPNEIQYAQDTAPAGTRRRYLLIGDNDCCDTDAGAHPGAGFHTSQNKCGSWDWNCDGVVTKCKYHPSSVCYLGNGADTCPGTYQRACTSTTTRSGNCGQIYENITGCTFYAKKRSDCSFCQSYSIGLTGFCYDRVGPQDCYGEFYKAEPVISNYFICGCK